MNNAVKNLIVKALLITICVVISLTTPFFIQWDLNVLFRDLYNPEGCIVLIPELRIESTLTCFRITYILGVFFLYKAESKAWLYILHVICTFLWVVIVAYFMYIVATD